MEPDFNSFGTIDRAMQECFEMGAFVCDPQELAFACVNRAGYNINFPNNLWLHTGAVTVQTFPVNSATYVAYGVYRRIDSTCFGPNELNSPKATTSYDLFGTSRNYACCMRH